VRLGHGAKTCDGVPEDTVNFQHDSLACAIALGWTEGVKVQELPVTSQIEDEWLRQRVEKNGQPMKIVIYEGAAPVKTEDLNSNGADRHRF
jgi:hypothetical protein